MTTHHRSLSRWAQQLQDAARPVQMGLCAAALSLCASAAFAQTMAAPNAGNGAPTAATAAGKGGQAKPPSMDGQANPPTMDGRKDAGMHRPPYKRPAHPRGPKGDGHRMGERDGMKREGMKGGEASGDDMYRRNAMARCDVFKTEEDRRACHERMRHGTVSGSVAGGGILREFTYQAPVKR
jgi:hypothetical protein